MTSTPTSTGSETSHTTPATSIDQANAGTRSSVMPGGAHGEGGGEHADGGEAGCRRPRRRRPTVQQHDAVGLGAEALRAALDEVAGEEHAAAEQPHPEGAGRGTGEGDGGRPDLQRDHGDGEAEEGRHEEEEEVGDQVDAEDLAGVLVEDAGARRCRGARRRPARRRPGRRRGAAGTTRGTAGRPRGGRPCRGGPPARGRSRRRRRRRRGRRRFRRARRPPGPLWWRSCPHALPWTLDPPRSRRRGQAPNRTSWSTAMAPNSKVM